jgi:DNA-binding transcriptional MocR family regulator
MSTALEWTDLFATRATRMRASEIRELLKLLDQPDIISFAGGIPDPALFPADAAARATSEILGDPKRAAQAMQYSVSEGYAPLREWIAGHMGRLGVECTADNILITNGSQQGLDFLAKLLISPGDTALVTAPTYLGALQAFNAYEPRYDRLHLDGGNVTPAEYAARAEAASGRVKLAYVVPDFANPTGETMDLAARNRLLDLAEELGIGIIEDTAYEALRFEGTSVTPILALDIARHGDIDQTRTIYCGTFSKTIAPAYRVGWICAAASLVSKLVLVKQAADLHSSTINQMVMHAIAAGHYEAQVEAARALYRGRRDAMLAALEREMLPPGVSWTKPEGGLFVWVTLPEGIDGAELLALAIASERVAFVPGSAFFANDAKPNTIRLNFSSPNETQIAEGIHRLARLIAKM